LIEVAGRTRSRTNQKIEAVTAALKRYEEIEKVRGKECA